MRRPGRLALLLALAACRGDDKPPAGHRPVAEVRDTPSVIGRWRGPHDQVELFANGRLLLHQGAYRVAGTYEFLAPRRLLLVYQNALAAVPPGDYRVAVTKDSLTFCESDAPARCVGYERMAAADSAQTVASGPPAPAATAYEAEPRLAAPIRPDQYPPEARAKEADGVLRQAYTLQQVYFAQYGHYAANMDSLRVVGWELVSLRHFQTPRVLWAYEDRLCIVAQPRAADLWPVHIDQAGKLGRGERC